MREKRIPDRHDLTTFKSIMVLFLIRVKLEVIKYSVLVVTE